MVCMMHDLQGQGHIQTGVHNLTDKNTSRPAIKEGQKCAIDKTELLSS